jgi:hypothetical protein
MPRTLLALLLVLATVAVSVAAPVYRCRTATGTLVFTDDPSMFPPGCKELPGSGEPDPEEVPAPATVPAEPREGMPVPPEARGEAPTASPEPPAAPAR